MCIAEGTACVYPAARPRQSKAAEEVPEDPGPGNADIPNQGPDDLGSLGFRAEPTSQPVHEPLDHSVNGPVQTQEQFEDHAHQTVNGPTSEPMAHQAETPPDMFTQTHSVYQHSSGLSFPQANAEVDQRGIPSAPIESTSMEYMPSCISEAPETALHSFCYPQPPAAPKAALGYLEQRHNMSSGTGASSSRRSLPAAPPLHGSAASDTGMDTQSTWQPMSGNPTPTVPATRSSPRQSRPKKPIPVSQAYDDLRQQQVSNWANASQSGFQTPQPVRNSPSQSTAQPAGARSRQSNRAQNHTPVNNMPAARKTQSQGTQSLAGNSGYASAAATQQPSSDQNQNTYNQYQSGTTRHDSSSDRVAYQQYPNNQTPTASTSDPSYDNSNSRLPNAESSTLSASGSQNVASSYPQNPTATPNAAQWGTTTSTAQGRNTRAYNATQSASGNASYNNASSTPQSQPRQGFSGRPQPPAQARNSSTAYNQPHQQRQQQQQQQQQSYNVYMNQQERPQQQASSSQQNWYGFGTAANSASSGYNSAAAAGGNNAYPAAAGTPHRHGHGHDGHGHQTQHQRSMNLSSHTYSSMDGDQALYDLLRSNPAG